MFESITDVKNYITKTCMKYSKEFVTPNYRIEYSNRLRTALATTHTRYLMGKPIDIKFVFNNKYLASYEKNEECIKDTVLHEIAHAIAGGKHHHDNVWVACCNKIGCEPSRFKSVTY